MSRRETDISRTGADRWRDELTLFLHDAAQLRVNSGYLDLVAGAKEACNLANDTRNPQSSHARDWWSLVTDITDAVESCGSGVQAVLADVKADLVDAISNTKSSRGKPEFNTETRAAMRTPTDALCAVLYSDHIVRAAWRDLVNGCKQLSPGGPSAAEMTHRYKTLLALLEYRNVDIASLQRDLIQVLTADKKDSPLATAVRASETDSSPDSCIERCEQLLVQTPERGQWIVWLRFDNAMLKSDADQRYGQVTFYNAQQLANWMYGDKHRTDIFDTTPTELTESHIVRPDPDDHQGFEPNPKMVYARIELQDIERHLAPTAARGLVSVIIAETNPEVRYWQLLGGHLVLAHGKQTTDYRLNWGQKQPLELQMYTQNDRMTANLRALSTFSHTINPASSLISEIARHRSTLACLPEGDSEATIMAAVRAIEHCNVWATNAPNAWHTFARHYLQSSMVRLRLLEVATDIAFAASRTPLDSDDRERAQRLHDINIHVTVRLNGQAASDRGKLLGALPDLAWILIDHPQGRALGDMSAVFTDPDAMRSEVSLQKERFEAQLQRLIRLRNAAMHGGPTSLAACASVRPFARMLAFHSLTLVSRALLEAVPVAEFFDRYRTRNTELLDHICAGGEPSGLIVSDPVLAIARYQVDTEAGAS